MFKLNNKDNRTTPMASKGTLKNEDLKLKGSEAGKPKKSAYDCLDHPMSMKIYALLQYSKSTHQ